MSKNGLLVLEDGKIYEGKLFGHHNDVYGELVFNTSMTGYQEIITDPSYKGQIVLFTYPQIGNYGVNQSDIESSNIQCSGIVVKENSLQYSNHCAESSLNDYLLENKITGLEKIDTRAVTKHIRTKGAMKCMIAVDDDRPSEELIDLVKKSRGIEGINLVKDVSVSAVSKYENGTLSQIENIENYKSDIVIIDCGIKFNILRILSDYFKNIVVVPYNYPYEKIMYLKPKGIFLSNGPGDPSAVTETIETVKKIVQTDIPVFGICLGIQILSLACGCKTYKLKFGHRAANHPVKNLEKNIHEITSQNHGFAVDADSINKDEFKVTHINMNDDTIEGIRHNTKDIFAVQYHPESSPGPHDSHYLFDKFHDLINSNRQDLIRNPEGMRGI